MTDRDKLPVKATTGYVIVPTEQSGSLVARGLEAVRNRTKPADPTAIFEGVLVSSELKSCSSPWSVETRV
jgi:hypothetical protein